MSIQDQLQIVEDNLNEYGQCNITLEEFNFLKDEIYSSGCLAGIEYGRADAIEECADKFADVLSNVPNLCGRSCPIKCNWGTEKSCKDMCKKWFMEQLKGAWV